MREEKKERGRWEKIVTFGIKPVKRKNIEKSSYSQCLYMCQMMYAADRYVLSIHLKSTCLYKFYFTGTHSMAVFHPLPSQCFYKTVTSVAAMRVLRMQSAEKSLKSHGPS